MVEGKMSVYLREGTSREIKKEQMDFVSCICKQFWLVMLLHKLSEIQTLAKAEQILLNSCSKNQERTGPLGIPSTPSRLQSF